MNRKKEMRLERKKNRIEKRSQRIQKKNAIIEEKNLKKSIKREKKDNTEKLADRFLSLFRFNITFKLTIGFLSKIIICIVLLNILLYTGMKSWMYMDAVKDLGKASIDIEQSLIENNKNDIIYNILEYNEIQYFLYDENKELIKTNIDNQTIAYSEHQLELEISKMVKYKYPEWFSYEEEIEIEEQTQLLLLRSNTQSNHKDLDNMMSVAMTISILVILSSWLSSIRLTKKHLKPIKTMTQKVHDISVNNLGTRLDVRGTKDELKDLAYTFNEMMDEIESSYEKQRQFVSDASHELRTPIAVIKGYASMVNRWGKDDPNVLEESIQAIEEEAKNMQSLVESLLFLARRDKGNLEMEREIFNIKGFMEEVVKETILIDSEHDIVSNIEYDGNVYASPDKLKQAIRIFIDNSIRYTDKAKKINISLRSSQNDIFLIVKDEGIGISKENLPYIFERFYRADQARTRGKSGGSGLGLAIAKVVIEQHDGKINVESEVGLGTTVTIIIPKNI